MKTIHSLNPEHGNSTESPTMHLGAPAQSQSSTVQALLAARTESDLFQQIDRAKSRKLRFCDACMTVSIRRHLSHTARTQALGENRRTVTS